MMRESYYISKMKKSHPKSNQEENYKFKINNEEYERESESRKFQYNLEQLILKVPNVFLGSRTTKRFDKKVA